MISSRLIVPGAIALSCSLILSSCSDKSGTSMPNVLFITVDDLRPELGCYGNKHIHSPYINQIANEGIVFNKAYCDVPVCGASRASLLTGIRPTITRFKTFHAWADNEVPGHLSLPRYLNNHGYTTISLGKVYHHQTDDLDAWSEHPWWATTDGVRQDFINPQSIAIAMAYGTDGEPGNGPAFEIFECHDTAYIDGKTTIRALDELKKLKDQDSPFFLGVGYLKPHLPFNAPKRYWDLYDHQSIELATNPFRPKNAPAWSVHNSAELRTQYSGVPPETPLPDDYARMLRHGYYACVSYIDAQIGILVNELKELELYDNTIIVILGDHGYNLGEHTMWCKHSSFDVSLRSPLIMRIPDQLAGHKTNALVEFVDIYPTIVDLIDLPIPDICEGKSLVPLINDPETTWSQAVYAWWRNGLTMTTQQYQYTEWMDVNTGESIGRMLYDHHIDPHENINVADTDEYRHVADSLSVILNKWWVNYQEFEASKPGNL